MSALDMIKNEMKTLYQTQPRVHVNVSMNNPKVSVVNEQAVIKGVYPHIFRIEDRCGVSHTMQYNDILTKTIEIIELGY